MNPGNLWRRMFGETETATLTVETFRDLVAEHAAPQVPLPQNPGTRVEEGRLIRQPPATDYSFDSDATDTAALWETTRAILERDGVERAQEALGHTRTRPERITFEHDAPRPIWGAVNAETIEEADTHTNQETGMPEPDVTRRVELGRARTGATAPVVPYVEIKVAYGTGHQWIYRTPDFSAEEISGRIAQGVAAGHPLLHLGSPTGEDIFISLNNVTGISISRKQGGRF